MLVTCGHAFCEGCLSRMLRCAPARPSLSATGTLKSFRPSEVQQKAIEESPAVDDKHRQDWYENINHSEAKPAFNTKSVVA
jgi:hypothetical protein